LDGIAEVAELGLDADFGVDLDLGLCGGVDGVVGELNADGLGLEGGLV
jgi:hypothetical protein